MLSGILCMNKPEGFTSFDVIGKLRGILKMKRLGHAGTLDPMATGVLPIFVGSATKACSIMPIGDKSYLAGFKLGIVTDTQDITGKVLEEKKVSVSQEQLKTAAAGFTGKIMQVPPMYSAVSVGGKRLYELARAGIEVERPAREAQIMSLEIREYSKETGEGVLYVHCGKGTYVRTLIHDIGASLGCGGTMTSLVRTSSNGFSIEDALSFEDVERLCFEDRIGEALIPCDRLFAGYPAIKLSTKKTEMYKNGVKLMLERLGEIPDSDNFRVYGADGAFIGIALADRENGVLRVNKNL